MRPPYSTLTPTHIYDYAASLLEPYSQWHDYGPKCTMKVLLQVLFYAAGHLCSVFAACREVRTAPSAQGPMPISTPPPCLSACTAVIGKGSADGMGAKPWSMPAGGSAPTAPPGFIKG